MSGASGLDLRTRPFNIEEKVPTACHGGFQDLQTPFCEDDIATVVEERDDYHLFLACREGNPVGSACLLDIGSEGRKTGLEYCTVPEEQGQGCATDTDYCDYVRPGRPRSIVSAATVQLCNTVAVTSHSNPYEAAKLGLIHGFDGLGLHKIRARTVAENEASKRIFEKLGFQQEGVLREHWYGFEDYVNEYRFGLLITHHDGLTIYGKTFIHTGRNIDGMETVSTERWETLERWTPRLFLLSGGILVIYATFMGLWAFADLVPEGHGLEIGYVLGFLGLIGLYPSLVRRSPWLARVGAVAAGCGVFAILYVSVNDFVHLAGLTSGNLPGWQFLRLLPLVGFILGYLPIGTASLRSDLYPRTVGLLLLLPGIITVLMLVSIVTGHPLLSRLQTVFVVSAGEAMAHLAIGTTLQTRASSTDDEEQSTEGDSEVVAHD